MSNKFRGYDSLEYEKYKHNRNKYPEYKPGDYQYLFKNWEAYEEAYQEELENEDN